jgi:cysteinyl-tRNA synthetase
MISFYNTPEKKKVPFKPLTQGRVLMYTCGPTVYDDIHMGNIRAYLTADTIRRILENKGFEVRHIKNITDVGHLTRDTISQGDTGEDKIEQKARLEKVTPESITKMYEEHFHTTEKEMNILPAHFFPKATRHISQMIALIERLIEKKHAYIAKGNVFFDVTSFSGYGNLSGNTLEKLKIGARLEEHPDKKNPWDFALWLKAPKEHIMHWQSPWSEGYPGWHIECSAMSMEYLGESFDIHTGGEDNIFPHHEAEIAQSECATDKHFCKYWIHTRHLLVDGEKMSKSKKNFYSLKEIKERGFSPMDLRLTLLSSHYRSQMNFSWKALEQSQKNLQKITRTLQRIQNFQPTEKYAQKDYNLSLFFETFFTTIEDDINSPGALALLYETLNTLNTRLDTKVFSQEEKNTFLKEWDRIAFVLGLQIEKKQEKSLPKKISEILEKRFQAKKEKNYALSDILRREIETLGYAITDSGDKQEITKN